MESQRILKSSKRTYPALAQKKAYSTKNPVCLPHPRKSENYAVRNRIHQKFAKKTKQASRNSNFSGKGVSKNNPTRITAPDNAQFLLTINLKSENCTVK